MKPVARDWVGKAEEDFTAAEILHRKRKTPVPSIVCFHCQQCTEKYLKARLHEAGIRFPKTHSLIALLDLLLPVEPLWEADRASLQLLTTYAVEFRYPGEAASKSDANHAVEICRKLRDQTRHSLGLRK